MGRIKRVLGRRTGGGDDRELTIRDETPRSGYFIENRDWPEEICSRSLKFERMVAIGRQLPEVDYRDVIEDMGKGLPQPS